MRISLVPALLIASLASLAACSSGQEAADEAAGAETANLADAGATTPAFDPSVDSESEAGEDGRRWFYKTESQSALYGPPNSEGMVTLRCDTPEDGEKVVLFNWFAPGAVAGAERVLELRSGGATERAEVSGVETELGGGAMWQARLAPGGSQAALLLDTGDPISLRLDDGDEYTIRVPASEQLRQVIRDCRASGTEAD